MKVKLLLFTVTICCLVSSASFPQALLDQMMPKPVPKSPNAAGIDRFGDYQVSHFTGLPNISIPIYEARSGALSVPITLNYHAAGNKPLDIAGWTGLGWQISTGGQLSRNVNGRPDEDHYLTHPLNPSPNVCTSFNYLRYAADGVIDTEPDVFNYSYPGGSGKFIFVNNGTYVDFATTAPVGPAYLFPYAPIVVNRVTDQKFEITDEKGILYRFGTNAAGVASTEFTQAFNGGNPSLSATTAWNLMEIIAPNSADAITYTYQNVGTANRHDVVHSWVVTDLCGMSGPGPCPPSTHTFPQPSKNTDSNVNQRGVNEIFFDNGKVTFVLSGSQRSDVSTLKSLDRIEVYELFAGTYALKKSIKFNYGYFTHAGGGNAALKLNSVQVRDASNAVIQTYTFTYFTNTFSWNPASSNFYSARDFFGFYNGAANTDLVLQHSVILQPTEGGSSTNPQIGGAVDRAVNATYSKEAVLKRIDFPTGGFTEFDFENHKSLNDQSVATLAGGLRVTKIVSKESASAAPVIKTYKYGLNESGVGRALFISNQLNYFSEQSFLMQCEGANPQSLSYRVRAYQSTFFNVDESSPVVYPYVTEYFGDPAGVTNGKTVYEYDAGLPPADVDQYVPASTKIFRNSFAWRRGKLTKKSTFDRFNNQLSEEAYQFVVHKELARLVGIGVSWFKITGQLCTTTTMCLNESNEPVDVNTFRFSTFTQSSGVLLPSITTTKTFENGTVANVVTTVQSNTYHTDKLTLMQSSVTRSNTNEETVTVNAYPFQYASNVNASSTGNARGIYMLNTKNILSTPLESYTYLQGAGGTNQRVVSAVLSTFRENASNANHVVPDQVFLFESAQPLTKASFAPMTVTGSGVNKDSRYALRLNFSQYDANSQITQFAKTSDVPNAFQYGYNNKLPVAEAKNANTTEFRYEGFEDSAVAGVVNNAAQAQTGRKYFNGDYTISFTKPNARDYVIEYFYFTSPNWIFIRKPYTGPTMALTEGTRIDNIRIRPADAPMTSYTYDPMYGISSATDPNGVTTFYTYDTFGRLQMVKDHTNSAVSTYNYHYYQQQP